MFTFFLILLTYNLFTITENRKCSGINGQECCTGYALNKLTGNCEKCPIGYLGDCSRRCDPPTYGEDCQSICSCPSEYCHFAHGCSQLKENGTGNQQTSSTRPVSEYFTAEFSTQPVTKTQVTDSLLTFTKDFSLNVRKTNEPSLNDSSKDGVIFKDNFVFFVIIILIGIFVLFFAIFVMTYIYFKCFRKSSNTSGIKDIELQPQYKSLDFEAMELETTAHQGNFEQRGRLTSDSAYLSPVFVRNESNTGVRVNDTRRVHDISRQETAHQTTNSETSATIPTSDQPEHVYIEITEDELETTNLVTEDDCENKEDKKNGSSLHRESTYFNENK